MELIDLLGPVAEDAPWVKSLLRELNPTQQNVITIANEIGPGGWFTTRSGHRIQLGAFSRGRAARVRLPQHKIPHIRPYKGKVFKTKNPSKNKNPKYKYKIKRPAVTIGQKDVLASKNLAARTASRKKQMEQALNEGWITKDGRKILIGAETPRAGVQTGKLARFEKEYPKAGPVVDGMTVRSDVPNMSSIGATLDSYKVMSGIREASMKLWTQPPEVNTRTKQLAAEIKASKEISPLIVVVDKEGPWILEGGHRFDALKINGAKAFPAVVVLDTTKQTGITEQALHEDGHWITKDGNRIMIGGPNGERIQIGVHGDLVSSKTAPSKDKPVVVVFGGSFNPPHAGHVWAANEAVQLLRDSGYNVTNLVVAPTADKLIKDKLPDRLSLADRTELAKLTFTDSGTRVTDAPAKEAEQMQGKLRRTQLADWAAKEYPGHTVINVTGEDSAPGHPPGYPSVYEGDKGSNHEGYYYIALPRPAGGLSSNQIRRDVSAGNKPAGMTGAAERLFLQLQSHGKLHEASSGAGRWITKDGNKIMIGGGASQVAHATPIVKATVAQANTSSADAEKHLLSSVIKSEDELNSGVTKTYKVTFADGTMAAFKPDNGEGKQQRSNIPTGMQTAREVGAWEVAKIVGMTDLVTPVVQRDFQTTGTDPYDLQGLHGVFSQWQDGTIAADHFQSARYDGTEDLARSAAFDFVIGNEDRHAGNWLVSESDKLQLIDHSLAFPDGHFNEAISNTDFLDRARSIEAHPSPEGYFPPSNYADMYVSHRQEIAGALAQLGLSDSAIKGVNDRIDILSNAEEWRNLAHESAGGTKSSTRQSSEPVSEPASPWSYKSPSAAPESTPVSAPRAATASASPVRVGTPSGQGVFSFQTGHQPSFGFRQRAFGTVKLPDKTGPGRRIK